ncbi:MAG: hypothetical protein FJW40_19845 [Acidobacteria bacterium]|nr:hypothetical protein [Acidobacteriota bacterium]
MRLALLAAAAFLIGCSSPAPTHVRIGSFPGDLYPGLATQLGHIRAAGITTEVQELPSNTKALEALLAGNTDVVSGTYEQALQMAAEGRDVQAFLMLSLRPGLSLVVSPKTSRRIASIGDLKGANVGVIGLGGSSQAFLNFLLTRNNVPADAVSTSAIGAAASAIAAVEQGQVNAAVVLIRGVLLLRARYPQLRVLAETYSPEGTLAALGAESLPGQCLLARKKWLDENPKLASAVAGAFRKTVDWAASATPEALRDQTPESARMPDAAAELERNRLMIRMQAPGGRMPEGGPALALSILSASNERVRNATIALDSTWRPFE